MQQRHAKLLKCGQLELNENQNKQYVTQNDQNECDTKLMKRSKNNKNG